MPKIPASNPHSGLVRARLLGFGGRRIYLQEPVPDELLVNRGRVFRPLGRYRIPGRPNYCHTNVALHYATHHALELPGRCEIVTGYALGSEEVWCRHSWTWSGKCVGDTTDEAVIYYSVVLSASEAADGVRYEVLDRLPGKQGKARE